MKNNNIEVAYQVWPEMPENVGKIQALQIECGEEECLSWNGIL